MKEWKDKQWENAKINNERMRVRKDKQLKNEIVNNKRMQE